MASTKCWWLRSQGLAGLLAGLILVGLPQPALAAVYLEDSPAALQLADEAADLQAQGRLGEAAQKLQDIVDEYPGKLMPIDETGYTDAHRWVRQRLAGDEALLSAYRRRFSAVAERALQDALAGESDQREARVMALLESYPLTPAGLEAAFLLTGLQLERGDGDGAAAMLLLAETHPDRSAADARYFELLAWSAALQQDSAARDAALAALAESGDATAVASLTRTLSNLPQGDAAADEPARVPSVPMQRPLWQVGIESSLGNKVVAQPRVAQNAAGESVELRPVAAGTLILINDNQRVYAIDRVSGRLRWSHLYGDEEARPNNTFNSGFGAGRVVQDRREALVHGENVYAILGFAVPWQGRHRRQVIDPTELVSLDRNTGELRWSVTPGELDPTLERAAFHGTPVSCGDQVIVMARRSQASSFQDSYLFAVDAVTGDLRWRRHLASTSGPNSRNALPPMSSMSIDNDIIYLCDNLGAAASVDARSGSIRWVRVLLEQQANARGQQIISIPFSEASRPVRSEAGLIMPMRINSARGMLLAPDTGEILEEFNSQSPLANAYEFAPLSDGDVLVIGPQLARLDGQTLEPRWTTPITPRNVEGITPRVSLWQGVAMVARETTGLQFIDLETGQQTERIELPWTGGVLATDDVWVVTSGRRLAGFLEWSVAYDTLRQRSEDQPTSPEPGLNMAMLAINADQTEAINEGVDRTLQALSFDIDRREKDPQAWQADRQKVFSELLNLTEREPAIDATVAERLFDRLAITTETPSELLAYNLARGDYLVKLERLDEAVDFYQAILLDPQQAAESLVRGQTTRRGDIAARLRLLRLGESGNTDFYARFDQQAERELSNLLASPNADVQALLDLARRYPLARVSAEAVFAAAQRQAQTDRHLGAITQYRRAFQLADNDDLRSRAAGALTEYYLATGKPESAVLWLEQVQRDHPALMPMQAGLPVDAQGWLAQVRDLPQIRSPRASLTPPFGETLRFKGELFPPADPENPPDRSQGVLYISGNDRSLFGPASQLTFYDTETHQHRWETPQYTKSWRLIDQGVDNLVLWQPQAQQLVALSASNGENLWNPIQVMPLLEDLGEGGLAKSRQANAGGLLSVIQADFGPINANQNPRERLGNPGNLGQTPPHVLAGEAVVTVIDARGRAFGLDRSSGLVLWQSALPIDVVSLARVRDDVLAVLGTVSPGTEAQSGRFLLIDLATGRMRFPPIENQEPSSDLMFSEDGDAVLFSRNQMMRYDRRDGGLRWRLDMPPFNGTPTLMPAGDRVFINDRIRLLSIDLELGVVQRQTPNLLNRTTTGGVTLGRDQMLYSLSPEALFALDADLNVRWQDSLASLPKQLVSHRVGERHVFAFEQYRGPEGPPGMRLSAFDRSNGRLIAQTMLTNLGNAGALTTVELLRDHLLVAGRGEIALIPGTKPAETDEPTQPAPTP
ncbi:outer membrane protein assembly factor BamB family protein [Algisphaera agarilytica]|uniref:Outer membrane protein assembly factor BamB n=1 Tax=Algisphaera agarilytica TaxID=1385975 RepID=A0A7X0HB45_9BACT|nr:PQQ-binding-like beta-propeller repeat protein [Algisphaera agarilytica]MBB6431481.1 outer membrane protein assembly factor BamB [Algisphaera agarilytica]